MSRAFITGFSASLLVVAATALSIRAEEGKTAAVVAVDGARALETVKVLASDAFKGRKSGLASGQHAEEWMAGQLESVGLEPGYKTSYFHEFKAAVTEDGGGALFAIKGGGLPERVGSYLTDYVTLIYSGKGAIEAEVVFAGYGIHAPGAPGGGRNDYDGLDVKGKIVMAVRGVPANSGLEEERFIGYKSSTAKKMGAAGFLLVEGDKAVPGTIQERYHEKDLPAVWLSRRAADDIFARAKKENLAAQVAALAKGERRSFPLGVAVRLEIAARLLKDQPMRNVVGLWRGDGSTDETVVLGAHLDHVGTDAASNVYNGADDNASGSAMLLEVARAIVSTGRRFRRDILFVWFAAEEQGLTGSRRFVQEPPVPLEKIAVMLNTDMVGQGKPVMAFGGAELYPSDARLLQPLPGAHTLFRSQPNSDHAPFQSAGVPAFFVHTEGPHPNYHQPGDDWPAIQPELLQAAGRFVRTLAERAADSKDAHCRPNRLGEYLWNRAHTFSLSVAADFTVRWFDGGAEEVMNGLAQDWDKLTYRAGQNVDALADELSAKTVLGVRGPAGVRLHRPARKLGAVIFAPYAGTTVTPTAQELRDMGPILWLEGAPDDPLLTGLDAAILVPQDLALKWKQLLQKRTKPWLAVGGPELREHFDPTHILVRADPQVARTLLDEKVDRVVVRGMFGENFLALLRRVK